MLPHLSLLSRRVRHSPICFVAVQNVRVFFLVPFSWVIDAASVLSATFHLRKRTNYTVVVEAISAVHRHHYPRVSHKTPLDDISLAIQHSALVTTDSLERVIVTVPGFTLHHRNTSTETLPRLFHVFRDLSTSSDIYTLIDNKPSELWFGGDSE